MLFRPLGLLQRLDEPLSVLVHKVCLCSKIERGSPSLCSSLRGLSSTIQLRIDSSQPAQACPWKFHNAAHTTRYIGKLSRTLGSLKFAFKLRPLLDLDLLMSWIIKPQFRPQISDIVPYETSHNVIQLMETRELFLSEHTHSRRGHFASRDFSPQSQKSRPLKRNLRSVVDFFFFSAPPTTFDGPLCKPAHITLIEFGDLLAKTSKMKKLTFITNKYTKLKLRY